MNNLPLVSIIIPVFNAQDTLERTLVSLQMQTYQYIELIFINDASTDRSLGLLLEFTELIGTAPGLNIKIISHEKNKGVSSARNTGLNNATGEFIAYVDADDTIQEDAIACCVKKALRTDADIIYFHWWLTFNKNERKMRQPQYTEPLQAILAMLGGQMRWNLWLFMVRRSLYETNLIRFIAGANMGEDLMVTMKLFVHARKIALLNKGLYHYRQDNIASISKTYSLKHMMDVEINIQETESYLKASNYADQLGFGIDFLKLNVKLPLLVSGIKEDFNHWNIWFSTSNKYILKNSMIPIRTRVLQWFAWKRQYWAVKIYNVIVLRLIYGIIYK